MGGSSISPDLFREERYRYGKFTCDVCGNAWPMTHQKTERGGNRVGMLCCYEAEGDELTRDLRRAAASKMAAQLSAKELRPPRAPNGSVYAGAPEFIDDQPSITEFSPSPAMLPRNGGPLTIVVTGVNFAATDVFTYASAGIIDDSVPNLISETQWQLNVRATGAFNTGKYGLTFAGVGGDTQIWRDVFDVR